MSKFKEERDKAADLNPRDRDPYPYGEGFEHGANWCLESSVMKNAIDALECNKTFHSLGGLDDCEPCKAKRDYEQALAEIRGEK